MTRFEPHRPAIQHDLLKGPAGFSTLMTGRAVGGRPAAKVPPLAARGTLFFTRS